MNLRTTTLRPIIVLALVAGMVAALVGLFQFNGPSPVSAQADNTAPTISSLAITSDTGDDDTNFDDDGVYGIGDSIKVTATFSESVSVTGTPQLELDIGDGTGDAAEYESVAGSAVVFSYTVAEGDLDDDGIAIGANKLTMNSGSIKDAADNAANLSHDALSAQTEHKVDGVRPTISSVSLVSSTGGIDGVYTAGETLTASVDFDEDVVVSGGPQLELDFEGTVKLADFSYADPKCEGPFCGFSPGPWAVRGIQLKFDYTVLSGDSDSDGAAVGADAVNLNGGAIKDAAGNDAELTHDAVPDDPGHKVSAVPPPPDNVRAVSQKRGAVKLTWKAPDNSRVTGYGIKRRLAGEDRSDQQRSDGSPRDQHTLVEDTGSADTDYTDESAEKGVEYEYRVSARNEAGPGEGSDWVRAGPESVSNSPATGLPTISGTAQVGETLTVGITGIADADGLSGETFTYQWVSSDGTTDTDIEKATGSTYKLVDADQGKAIKVRVTFTDDGGNEETLTSAPTGPVWGDGPPGAPRNLAATAGNKEVTLSWDPPADNGNAPATGYRIEWRVDGKDYENHWGTARSTTYTTNVNANLANGVKYFFRVKAGNGSGNSQGPYGPASGEVSATPTSGSAVDLGTPVLSNTENLHHGMVRLDWEDVEDAGWYVVQYYRVKGGEWLDLPAEGVDIAFHGSSAVVSDLHGLSWLRVRAMSCAGASEWSQIEQLFGTNASDWEDVPVPEVAEGDEIEPCPVVLGTPVLSDTETLHHGMVQLNWEDIEDAGWYVVQYYHVKGGEWLDLPAEGVDIAFHGSSAVVSNLHGLSWLRVRAMSCAGASEWSQIEQLFGTNASDWEGVPVPEVAEGDEIEPCSEDADTSDNSPATGAPTIIGTAQVGEALTVDTSGIADADGLTSVTYSYQWLADDAEIAGATSLTYTLADTDEGKAIKAKVSFTDDVDNEETLTSAATPVVAVVPVHAKSAPDLEVGTPWVAHRRPLPLPAGSRFTLSIRVTNAGDGASEATRLRYYRSTDSTITSSDTEQGSESVGALAAAGRSDHAGGMTAPSEAGTYYYGACVDSVTNESDTTDNCSSAHLLIMSEPAPDLVVIGIDASDNIVTGGSFQVGVTVTNQGAAQSAETTLRWKQLVDGTTTEIGTVAQRALTRPQSSFKTIWLTAPSTPGTSSYWACVDSVAGEYDTTNNCSGSVTVTVTNNLATGAPTISGTSQVGQTLTADTSGIADADGLANATFSYQWLSSRDTEIGGATSSTYTLQASEESKAITVQVSFTDDAGNQETLTSAATAAVAGAQPTEPPAKPRNLSATATHDSVTLTWDDPGDNTITGYVILRRVRVNDTGGEFSELVPDTGSAATTYTDDAVVAGTTYTYRIKAINEHGGVSERSRWFHIDIPAAPVPDKPTGLSATASHDAITLTWDDPGDDSITGYVILRRLRYDDPSGHFDELVADTGTAATTYTDDTVEANTHYTYRIKAINGAGTSERSRWFHIDIPAAP